MLKIVIASDHAGFVYKEKLTEWLINTGYLVKNLGCYTNESCDYPEICEKVVKALKSNWAEVGILLCGTGIGISMCANRYQNIRAANCFSILTAQLARQHNNANIVCIGARLFDYEEVEKIVKAFLTTEFCNEERHKIRINKFNYIGES